MTEIRAHDKARDFNQVLELYTAVNWLTYTNDPEKLGRALGNSHDVFIAESGGEVVGLIRTISDGEVICYIQDLLVHPTHQRTGVGRALMNKIFETSPVRQLVLMTDNEPKQKKFYEALGFQLVEGQLNAFLRLS